MAAGKDVGVQELRTVPSHPFDKEDLVRVGLCRSYQDYSITTALALAEPGSYEAAFRGTEGGRCIFDGGMLAYLLENDMETILMTP